MKTVFMILAMFLFSMVVMPDSASAQTSIFGDKLQAVAGGLPIAAITTSGDGSAVDLQLYQGQCAAILDVSAPVSGTNPTLDIKFKHSATSGGSYVDVTSGDFTQVTSAASYQKLVLKRDSLKRYVKVSRTIGGTASPQYLASVRLFCEKRRY